MLDDSGSEATDLYQNGTSGAGETSGSVLRTRTWVASQAVRPASIPSLSATCATVPIKAPIHYTYLHIALQCSVV